MKIVKCNLKNNRPFKFGNINIFVGPNGVGKTTLLNEIREFFLKINLPRTIGFLE